MRTRGGPQPPAPGGPSLRLGIIGAGGRGTDNLEGDARGAAIVALCDCDQEQAAKAFRRYPEAKRYRDWRKMLERGRRASTPCSSPRPTTTTPSSRSRRCSSASTSTARSRWRTASGRRADGAGRARESVATQMGTQGHAFEGTRRAVEVIRGGAIGEVARAARLDRPPRRLVAAGRRAADRDAAGARRGWTGTSGSAPRPSGRTTRRTCRSSGAAAGISAPAPSATWASTTSTPPSGAGAGPADVGRGQRLLAGAGRPATEETAPLWSIIELHFPARGRQAAGQDDLVRRRQAAAGGAVPGREDDQPGRRLAGRRQQGNAVHPHLARRRERRRHVRAAAAQAVRRLPAPRRRRSPASRATTRSGSTLAGAGARRSPTSATPPC